MSGKKIIDYPLQAIKLVKPIITDFKKEHLLGIYLDSRYEILVKEIISIGIVDSHIVHPREVFKPAIINSASFIIILHNHPSENVIPTKEDIEVTEMLKKAGDILGIQLLDHIIFTEKNEEYCSFKINKKL